MDVLTPQQRRRCMQHNRSRDTKPERMLGRALWRCGIRYRKHPRHIPGCPDFCIKRYKLAIFVDGDFWHGRDWPAMADRFHANRDFWVAKIERNRARDLRVTAFLHANGWTVFRFWESDLLRDLGSCIRPILTFISQFSSISVPTYLPTDLVDYPPIPIATPIHLGSYTLPPLSAPSEAAEPTSSYTAQKASNCTAK